MLFDRRHLIRSRQKLNLKNVSHKKQFFRWLTIFSFTIASWISYRTIQNYFLPPEAILVLGGHETREKFAADLARQHPHLDIWISSGSPQTYVKQIFSFRGIKSERLYLDYQAEDTVSNFTTIVDRLKARDIDSVYLITSDNHMTRARVVGEIVFGSRGIAIKPVSVPSHSPPEPIKKSFRDGARAILWLTTGHTGSNWKHKN